MPWTPEGGKISTLWDSELKISRERFDLETAGETVMAEGAPHTPWFETLKAISKNTGRNASLSERPRDRQQPTYSKQGSGGRRISPALADVGAGAHIQTTNSEGSCSADISLAASTPSSFSFSKSWGNFPLASEAQNSADSPAAVVNDTAAQSTRDTRGDTSSPHRTVDSSRDSNEPSAPHKLSLTPPPAVASPVSYSKSYQLPPGTKDFYFEPTANYDLGPESKSRTWGRRCCYCILTLISLVFVGLGIVVAVLAVKMNPKVPSLSIANGITVTSLNFSEPGGVPKLQLALHFSLNLTNPNKYAKAVYSQISGTVFYNSTLALGNFDLPGFVQGTRQTHQLYSGNLQNVTSVPADAVVGLSGEVTSSDVSLDLNCSAGGKFQILWFKVKQFAAAIDCNLNVKPGPAVGQQAQTLYPTCKYK